MTLTDLERDQIRRRIEDWAATEAKMEELRRKDMENADLAQMIEEFEDVCEYALRNEPKRLTSGLVEQQYWFSKLRK